jgi:hypothetical protein
MDALGRALTLLGASVRIDAHGENLVRAVRAPVGVQIPPTVPHVGAPVVEVCAQGLPNLLHEFVHVILAARLDDDHGIDYQAIPFDLADAAGRAVLFEELACCVLSCSYLCADETEATRHRVDEWFVEQVEIQPVFYGMEDDVDAFWRRVHAVLSEFREDWSGVLERAYARAEQTLRWAGTPSSVAAPPIRLDFFELLARRDAQQCA